MTSRSTSPKDPRDPKAQSSAPVEAEEDNEQGIEIYDKYDIVNWNVDPRSISQLMGLDAQ